MQTRPADAANPRADADLVDGACRRGAPSDARGRSRRCGHGGGRSRRLSTLHQCSPADGLSRPGAERTFLREHCPARRDYQGRQCASTSRTDRGRLDLSYVGPREVGNFTIVSSHCPRRSGTSPGKRRSGYARDIGASLRPASRRSWSLPRSPARWSASSGRSPALRSLSSLNSSAETEPTKKEVGYNPRCTLLEAGPRWGTLVPVMSRSPDRRSNSRARQPRDGTTVMRYPTRA